MTAYLDDAIGETRFVRVDADGRPRELRIERWSERDRIARAGEIYLARVARVEARLGGAFVDLGLGPEGFLPFRQGRAPAGMHEGQRIKVEIAAEAAPGKGPRLRRLPDAAETDRFPARIAAPPPLVELEEDAIRGPDARHAADQALEAALAHEVALEGGGSIAIETTRALVAIDVDAGTRAASDPARLALATNLAAIDVAARHVGLRALSGLVVLDLLDMRAREARDACRDRMIEELKEAGAKAEVGLVSRLGLLEFSVERRRRPLHEVVFDGEGRPTPETVALSALRRLEDEAVADRGARLMLRAPAAAAAWLDSDPIGWKAAMTKRIGARFALEAQPDRSSSAIEVRTL